MRREQVAVAERVERRDERKDEQSEAEPEQSGARPRRVVGAAAPAEADEPLQEAHRADGRERDRERLGQATAS